MSKRSPGGAASSGYRRILWPHDFSRLAKAALPHALKVAKESRAEIVLLHVVSPPVLYATPVMSGAIWTRMEKEVREAAADRLEQVVREVRAAKRDVRVRTLVVQGSPFLQIPRAAKRLRCDLIVLATHGHTGLRHVLLGSVAENVVRHAPCPVLTVRAIRERS